MKDQTGKPETTIEHPEEMPDNLELKKFDAFVVIGNEKLEEEGKVQSTVMIKGNGVILIEMLIKTLDSSEDLSNLFNKAYAMHMLNKLTRE